MTPFDHNQGPDDANPLEERLREANAELFREVAKLEEAASEAPQEVLDEEGATVIITLASAMQKLEKSLEGRRIAEKEEYLAAGRTVDDVLGSPKRTLETRRKVLMDRVNAYNTRKAAEARAAAQAAELERRRIAEEARQAEEAARAADRHVEADIQAQVAVQAERGVEAAARAQQRPGAGTTRTEAGTTAFQRKEPRWEVTDADQVRQELGAFAPFLSRETVEAALSKAARSGDGDKRPWPIISGVRFYMGTATSLRG